MQNATLESTADGILVVNREGRMVSANHKFREMWRLPEDIVASGDDDRALAYVLGQLEDPQSFLQKVRELYDQPAAESYDILHYKDGRVFERYSIPQYLDNQIVGRVWSFRDITSRVQAEQALRRAKEEWELTFDAVPEFIMILDKNHLVRRVNRAMAEALRSFPEALIGKPCYELVHQTNAPPSFCPHTKTLADSLMHTTEVQELGLDFLVTTSPLKDNDGHTIGSVHMARDITESKKAEEEHLRFSKLESLSTLAGGIAHDFNNILTAIIGNLSLAMIDPQNEEYLRTRLNDAERACLQAQSLSRQLLTFAKGGAPIKKLVSLKKLITESATFASSGSQVRCEVSFPDNLWAAEVDPGQIGQVIQNLVINANQAMPTGGTIKVQGENLVVATESSLPLEAGNYVKISTQDQGVGIPADHLPRIFDPYFTTKQAGSGLGLSTVYSIIKNHQGHIAVESKLGAGTTCHIYLPAVPRAIVASPEEDRELLTGLGTILIMDDEEIVREVLGRMLRRLGYEAEFAADGAQAIEKFSQAKKIGGAFAAVILDLTVPGGMGGKITIENLLKIDPQVKAIVSSGYSDDPIMADFENYGFSAVIAKPYRIAELSKILQGVITK